MFNLDDEDDEDFNLRPEISSKLSNLFESNEINLDIDSSNKSLKYTPQKQPKKFEISGNPSGDNVNNSFVMTLIHASAVNVFKFENGKYAAQGKLGAALLGNHDTRTYKLIIYTGKQQHITFASINDNFKLICQPNNYFSFYDDNRQNWSVMFDTEEEKLNFSRQLTVCKFTAFERNAENESKILTQDLVIGNENSLFVAEDNDNIELRYKGWLFEDNQTTGKLFANIDSSAKKPFRIRLIGKWTQILKGMKIGAKRFAIFAPNLREQLTGILENAPISQNCKYGFDFELIKIQTRVQQKPESKPQIETKPKNIIESEKDKNTEQKLHSISITESVKESESQPKSKSDILSRVSRMGGLPILPMKTQIRSETTDTIDAIEDETSQTKPHPKPRNSSFTSVNNENNIQTINQKNENNESLKNFTQISMSSLATNSMPTFPSYFLPQSLETNLSILSSETRSNQSEIRMNLTKIIDKIDSISEKVSDIKNSSPQINSMSVSSIGFMDSAILLSSIQKIVSENNTLKKEVEEKTTNLQKLNEKIVDLLHLQNIQSTGAQQNSSKEVETLLMSEKLLKREISDLTKSCDQLSTQSQELSAENSRLKQTVDELRTQIECQQSSGRESNSGQTKETLTQIKKIMNEVFRKISAQINENNIYKSDEIIDIVSNSIRNTTLSLMGSRNNSRTNSPFRQSVDEIDKNKQNLNSKSEKNSDNELEKPPIPKRKSIETEEPVIKSECTPEKTEESK